MTGSAEARALDALPFQTAILDGEGVVIATNRAWERFTRENGGDPGRCGVGASYVGVCAALAAEGVEPGAGELDRAVRDVAAGRVERIDFEYPCDSPSERRWFLMTAARLDPPGSGAVVTHVDITRRKAQELGIEEFSMSLAHDLKAPLRTSVGLAELIVTDLERGRQDPEVLGRRLDALRTSSARGRAVLEAIVQRLRMERPATMRRVAVDASIARAIAAAAPRVREAQAQVEAQSGLPDVLADPERLHAVLGNLIENAIKYRGPDRPCLVRITGRAMGSGHLRLTVADNGLGIAPEHAELVFAPLRRIEPDAAVEGIGIGLSLCRAAVESMGGRIWVDLHGGEGARLAFTLRLADAAR